MSAIEEGWAADNVYITVHIDMAAIEALQLEVTLEDIRWAIIAASKLKIQESNVEVQAKKNRLRIIVTSSDKSILYLRLRAIKRQLPRVVIKVG